MGRWLKSLVQDNSTSLGFQGSSNATIITAIGELSLNGINVDLVIELKGMNNFPNVTVNGFSLPGNDPIHNGILLNISVSLDNPTLGVVSGLGDVTFKILYQESEMGFITAKNLELQRGVNNLRLNGYLAPNRSVLPQAQNFFNDYLNGLPSLITCRGHSTTIEIEWINSVLTALHLPSIVPGANLSLIKSMTPQSIIFGLSVTSPPLFGATFTSLLDFPFGFDYLIHQVKFESVLLFNGTAIGTLDVPWIPTQNIGNALNFTFQNISLGVLSVPGFQDFLLGLFLTPSVELSFKANVSVIIDVPFGPLNLTKLPVQATITIPGLNNFNDPPIYIRHPVIVEGTYDSMTFSLDIIVTNPSFNDLTLGALTLQVMFEETNICNGTVDDMILKPGENVFKVFTTVLKRNSTAVPFQKFLSNYLNGISSNSTLQGSTDTTPIVILKKAASALHAPSVVPGISAGLLNSAILDFQFWKIIYGVMPVQLYITNPFLVPIHMGQADVQVTFKDQLVGAYKGNSDIFLPPNATVISQKLDLDIKNVPLQFLYELFALGDLKVTLIGRIGFLIGNFSQKVDYVQNNIPATWSVYSNSSGTSLKLLPESKVKNKSI